MTQTWDPKDYAQNAAFVHGLAGEVLEWLGPCPTRPFLILAAAMGN